MHTIRLRDPWESEQAAGRAIYRRHFNRPTGLTAGDVVRLVVDGLPPEAVVSFNGEQLGSGQESGVRGAVSGVSGGSWDITAALQLRNAVVIEVPAEALPIQRPFGEVRIEILMSNS